MKEAKAPSDIDSTETKQELKKEAGHKESAISESLSTKSIRVERATSSNENHGEAVVTDTDAPATSSKSTQTHLDKSAVQSIQTLQEQVQQLQDKLAETESLLTRERQVHSKVLQQHEERTQALQLRCYISETRSRAFEEALQQHNEAVANNVALTPSKTTKGEMPIMNKSRSTETMMNKPLYSRATSSLNNESIM